MRWRGAAIMLLLCLLAVEGAGVAFHFWQTGELVYLRRPAAPVKENPAEQPKGYRQRLHPYFGFTGPYGADLGRLHTNSLGFRQREKLTIPFVPAKNDVVVAVFGGSVASNLVMGWRGGTPLADSLRALPAFEGRNPVVINMAQGSAKQPQQLIKLAYLLAIGQRIDLAINVDGFNEFALGWQNVSADLDPVFPAAQFMAPMLAALLPSPASEEFYGIAHRMLEARRLAAGYSARADRARSGVTYAWAVSMALWYRMQLSKTMLQYDALVLSKSWSNLKPLFSLDLPKSEAAENPQEKMFAIWLRCSQQMKMLSDANAIKYVHVVQPNQYYSRHAFSDDERKVALAFPEDHEYRVGIVKGYPLFAARDAILKANRIVSALGLFDDIHEEVYADACCHYNARGETALATFVAAEVAKAGSR